MEEQMNKKEIIDEKKLKRIELILGFLGLAVAVITFIFLFVKAISFNVEIVEGEAVNFSTSVFRVLGSDFNLTYGNTGLSYWELFRSGVSTSELKDYSWLVVACSWISLIGCIASVILYVLFMLGKRAPFFCEMASRCAAIGCGITLLFFLIGEIPVSGEKLFAKGISYNFAVPLIYAIIMAGALICISFLCSYSKARHEVLKQAKLQKAAENTIALKTAQDQEVQTAQITPNSYETANKSNLLQQSQPVDYEAQKRDLRAKYVSELHANDMSNFDQAINELPPQKYNQLMQQPIKKKVVTILFSIFLGGIGVDRFYIGDVKLGVLKIVGTVAAFICNFIPILGIIVNLANGIWKFVDIFFSYKKGKTKNYENAMAIIKS